MMKQLFLLLVILPNVAFATADRCTTLIDGVQYNSAGTTNVAPERVDDDMSHVYFIYEVTHAGTGTLDVTVEHGPSSSGSFYDVINSPFSQATSTSLTQTLSLDQSIYPVLEYVRPVVTVTGGSADYTVTLTLCYGVN